MTSCMVPAVSIMVCNAIILVFTYFYLYYLERKSFVKIWIVSWITYLFAQIITLIIVSGNANAFLSRISGIIFLISALLLIWGTYDFLGKRMPKWCTLSFILSIIWVVYANLFNMPDLITNLPITIFLGISTMWIGIIFIYHGEGQKKLRIILGGCFIIWGLHKMDYAFLRNVTWFAPLGYIISASFSVIITMTFIFIYFEKIRNELIDMQNILSQNEKKLRNIIENQKDVIFEIDMEGNFIFVSPSCYEMVGMQMEEIIGKSFAEFIGQNIWQEILTSKPQGINIEKSWIKRDKTTSHMNIYCKPNFNEEGKLAGVFGSIHDITENKLLDEARQYDRLKTEFFANISHELRTPLSVILASTQLLELYNENGNHTELLGKVNKTTKVIKQNIYRLTRLINNLIDITKVDTGFLELQLGNYNIVSIVEDITMSIVDYANNKGISIQFDTDIEEKIIACDMEKIERVILNLISNSVKFTNEGGLIMVQVYDGEKYVSISVKDTGIGIPKDKQEVIFERFRQVDKSLSRNNEGSGIGLSLVKSIVELHGGEITLESEYGHGSEFIIKLPVKILDEEKELEQIESFEEKKTDIEFSDIYTN